MKRAYDAGTRTLSWTFGGNVSVLRFVVPDTCNPDDAMYMRNDAALVNGFSQKIGDSMAIGCNTNTGKSATDENKRAAGQEMIDRLNAGGWNAETRAKKTPPVDVDALVAAIAATINKSVVGVRQFVEAKPEDGRRKLAESKEFAAAYAIALAQKRPVTELDEDDSAELDALPDDWSNAKEPDDSHFPERTGENDDE